MNRLSRYCDGLIEASWLMAIVVTTLAINNYTDRTFEPMKVLPFRSIVWIALAAWGVKVLSQGGVQFKYVNRPRSASEFFKLPLTLPVTALVISMLISLVFSVTFFISLKGSDTRAAGVLTDVSYVFYFILIAANLRRRDQFERILVVLAFSSFLVAVYGIFQRMGLDPYIWAVVNVKQRSASTIGHPIFAAAFMTMVFFVLAGKTILAVSDIRSQKESRASDLIRAILYGIIALLNLVGIWAASSRGPMLGFMAGLGVFLLFLLSYWQMKRTLQGTLAIGVIAFLFLILLNVPTGPVSSFRDSTWVGPLGHVFESESGTGQVRSLVWNGMARLVAPHDPIQFPSGESDKWNFLRPLIGYGSDTLSSTFEGYYDSKIYLLEAPNALFDRAHNHFWDTFAFYGILGMCAKYGLFLSIIFYVLNWLGWLVSPFEKKLYWGLSATGGFVGGIAFWMWQGVGFIGLGFPLGLLAGLGGIFLRRVFNPSDAEQSPPRRAILLIVFLSAIISNYIELLFGIAVVNTSLLFWLFCALTFIVGSIPSVLGDESALIDTSFAFEDEVRQMATACGVMIGAAILMGYWLVYEQQVGSDISTTLANALTTLHTQPRTMSYGMLFMLLGFVLIAPLLLQVECDSQLKRKPSLPNILLTTGVLILSIAVFWSIRASQCMSFVVYQQAGDIDNLADVLIGTYTFLYVSLLAALLVTAYALSGYSSTRADRTRGKSLPAIFSYVALPLFALGISIYFNMYSVYADLLVTLARGGTNIYRPEKILPVYTRGLEYDPTESSNLIHAYDIYPAVAVTANSQASFDQLFRTGAETLKRGYDLQPLYVNNSITLAYYYQVWSEYAADNSQWASRLAQADRYYQYALKIKPNRVDYLVEWAKLSASEGDASSAEKKIQSALAINPNYEPIYYFAGTIYLEQASRSTDGSERAQLFDQSMHYFQTDLDLLARQGGNQAFARLGIARIYAEQKKFEEAKSNYLQALNLGLENLTWQAYAELAGVYQSLNDPDSQREYLQKAIAIAPADQISALQTQLNALQPYTK